MSRKGSSPSSWVSQDSASAAPSLPNATWYLLLARPLGEPRGRFPGGSQQNCEGTPRAAKGRVAACRLRGEWPKAKVSREGSTLPAAGASTGQHPRAPRLRVPERRCCLSGPRPLRAQPGRPLRPRLETPSGCSWRDTAATAPPCQDLPTSSLSGSVTPGFPPTALARALSPNSAFPVVASP